MVGERTNVTGSRRFATLITSGDFTTALEVAVDQVRNGANIIDINMDEGMLDSPAAMTTFLNLIAGEPEIARVPIMIDSSRWDVIEAGLKCCQGKCVVNSISLKEGEREFLRLARRARALRRRARGHGVRRRRPGRDARAARGGLPARLPRADRGRGRPAPGHHLRPEHLRHRRPASRSTRGTRSTSSRRSARSRRACPGVKISGGVSNLSFSFRGNDVVREAMHTAFLYHAIAAGMDMGIVNAGQLGVYDKLDPELRDLVEDVIFDRRPDATERLLAFAATISGRDGPARAGPGLA